MGYLGQTFLTAARLALISMISLVISACGDEDVEMTTTVTTTAADNSTIVAKEATVVVEEKLTFFAVGRQGYGNKATREIALSMEALASARNDINFTLLLGDNFYPTGVESIDDPQWAQKFELLYDGPHEKAMPFFVVLGNHDYQGNVGAQLQYAREHLGSARWTIDAPYYSRDFGEFEGRPLVRIVFLDSVLLSGSGDTNSLRINMSLARNEQIAFLREAFEATENEPHWKVIASHYPFRSNTSLEASKRRVMSDLLPILKEVGADLVISANDRFQQVLDIPEEPLHVSTNGGGYKIERVRRVDTPSVLTVSQRGFGAFTIDPDKITVELYDQKGNLTCVRSRWK